MLRTLCLSIALLPANAAATPARSPFDLTFEELLDEIVVASARPETAAETPVIVSRIDATQARALGAETLADWLGLLPGVIVQRAAIGVEAVMVRGLVEGFNQKVLFLLDGVPYWSPTHADFPLQAIPVALVDRIEMIRGPGAVLYGSNATAGVINVVTRVDGPASVALSAGSQQRSRAEALLRGDAGGGQWIVGLSRSDGAEYDGLFTARAVPAAFPAGTPSDGNVPRDQRQQSVFARYRSPSLDLRWHAFHSDSDGLAGAASLLNRSTLTYRGQQFAGHYRFEFERQSLSLYADYTRYGITIPTANVFLGRTDGVQRFADGGRGNNRARAGADWQYRLAEHGWLLFGAERENRNSGEYQLRRIDGSVAAIQMQRDHVQEQAVWGQWDQTFGKLRTVLGVRHVHNSQFGDALLPRLSFGYRPDPRQSWRLVYSEGYNAPVFLQLNIRIPPNALVGNPDLAAERVRNLELAWNWQSDAQQLQLSAYRLHVDAAIQRRLVPGTSTVSFFNAPAFARHGAELEWRLRHERWQWHANAAWQAEGDSDDDPFSPFAPRWQAGLATIHTAGPHQWGANYRYIGTRAAADPLHLLSVQYRHRWQKATLGIGLHNLLHDDQLHADVQDLAPQRLVPDGPDETGISISWTYEF